MASEVWTMVSFECGVVAIVTGQDRLIRICFESSKDDAVAAVRRFCPGAVPTTQGYPHVVVSQLTEFFYGTRDEFDLALCNDSLTDFAVRVQKELLQVPAGSVISYSELAARAGSPGAARAVGGVMSANPFPLVVPCHRVVNADGRPGRYSAARGAITKTWLLDFERTCYRPVK